ncbi:uncharacterized protein O3C94_022921, partial [Discoglossus pictus]
ISYGQLSLTSVLIEVDFSFISHPGSFTNIAAHDKGPLDVKPPVVSKVEQEDLNIRDQQQVKEEESPWNIREGPQDGDLYPDLINEDGEYERDEKSIHQMETHSDPCTEMQFYSPDGCGLRPAGPDRLIQLQISG